MASLPSQESLRLNEELMARRLKNRERQRRYRAKKRLEAEMKKAYVIEQQALFFQVDPHPHLTPPDGFAPSTSSTLVDTQSKNPTVNCVSRVYSGRKWKKDARTAHASEGPENFSLPKAFIEDDSNTENSTGLSARRDWKADARNKMEMAARESNQQVV